MVESPQYRHELKYDISFAEYLELVPRLRAVMQRDPHAGAKGVYRIRSIYFDNYRDKALREKIDGVAWREKFRIRWYDDDFSFVRLEKKIKDGALCMKQDVPIDRADLDRLLGGDMAWMSVAGNELIHELYIKTKMQQLRPRVVVSYLREPYIYRPGNVRVTFDSRIRTSLYQTLRPGEEIMDLDAQLEPGRMILEVKYDAYLPEIISMLLQVGWARQTSFSKYGVCRRFG